jgi:hypothetical protein
VDIVLAFLILGGVVRAQFVVRARERLRGEQLSRMLALRVLAMDKKMLFGLVVEPGDLFNVATVTP